MPDDVDVKELIAEVLSVLPPPNGVTVTPPDGEQPVTVRADRDMLRQVLLNLVGNGYQAMPDGGAVTIGATASDGVVQITVCDTGTGMSEEVQSRLFEPFFTTKARGVGLGLVVTRRIIDAHGGDITVESTEGAGTEFRVVLPSIAEARRPADDTVSTNSEVTA
jgi:signal transduction histidine kinase